jgi:hypothetical protein
MDHTWHILSLDDLVERKTTRAFSFDLPQELKATPPRPLMLLFVPGIGEIHEDQIFPMEDLKIFKGLPEEICLVVFDLIRTEEPDYSSVRLLGMRHGPEHQDRLSRTAHGCQAHIGKMKTV